MTPEEKTEETIIKMQGFNESESFAIFKEIVNLNEIFKKVLALNEKEVAERPLRDKKASDDSNAQVDALDTISDWFEPTNKVFESIETILKAIKDKKPEKQQDINFKGVEKLLKSIRDKKTKEIDLSELNNISGLLATISASMEEFIGKEDNGKEDKSNEDKLAELKIINDTLNTLNENVISLDFKFDYKKLAKIIKDNLNIHISGGGGGIKNVNLENKAGTVINPATEEKQDDGISELQTIITTQTDGSQKTKIVDANNVNATGEVQTTPTANTILGRLKDIWDRLSDGTQITKMRDGAGNPLSSYEDETGKYVLNTHDAHVHNILINRHFIDFDTATENPSTAIVSGDTTILVASTTGFNVGDHIVIKDAGGDVREHHFNITAITVDTSITVNRPIDMAYTTSATLEVIIMNMAVVGSLASPVIYEVKPPSDEVWHITRILMSMTDQTAMDDALFGGLPALTNGVTLVESRVEETTFSNWLSNGAMKEDMFDVDYSLKAPAGFYGLNARWTFEKAGVVARLEGSRGDSLKILIQDDLTNLDTFRIKAQGHIE